MQRAAQAEEVPQEAQAERVVCAVHDMRGAPQKVSVVSRSKKRESIRNADIVLSLSILGSFPMADCLCHGKSRAPTASSQRV
jgi:hypothetical protein